MARSRPADRQARSKERQPIMPKNGNVATTDEFGEDPWVVGSSRSNDCRESPVNTTLPASDALPAPKGADEQEHDDVALPTPIAQGMWKVTAPDGREVLSYQPIRGFEHLLHGMVPSVPSQRAPSYYSPGAAHQPSQQLVPTQEPGLPGPYVTCPPVQYPAPVQAKRKTLKRSRSVTRPSTQHQRQVYHDNEEEFDDDNEARTSNEAAYTFYVGDIDQLSKFYRRRLEELTMKPLRPIVTAWIKQLEPRRLGSYGPYHKKMPSQRPPECTPDWWPRDVRYEEPSHLDKTGLLKVAVTMMLQHRAIDEPKRKGSWVAKLQQAAQYAIETTPPEQFSSSKGSGFSERMRDRALNEIMPSLFSIAQIHEDHLAQYNLYEGRGNVDTRRGTMCTWQPVSRPPRQSTFNRKRAKVPSRAPRIREVSEDTVSGDDTEVDDTISNTFLRRERAQYRRQQRTPKATRSLQASPIDAPALTSANCASTPSRGSTMMATPNGSFERTMTGLCLEGDVNMDVKYVDATHFSNPDMMCNMFALSQPVQYSVSQPSFDSHSFHGQENVAPFPGPAHPAFDSGSVYDTAFTAFNTPYPQEVRNAVFNAPLPGAHHHGFPYGYDGGFPAVSGAHPVDTSFHGPPADLEMNSQFSHHH
ncbi:hypothetical protein IAQ61_011971 [Plenodomus lingam]|uniref:uncharacterized protein n=1 Tax=Leptosphaeria maculans TaxID=5022 RepID=UPI00331BDC3E|nr:hypothetical protein IAQ61_011971 [Plenodomus lingam]